MILSILFIIITVVVVFIFAAVGAVACPSGRWETYDITRFAAKR